MFFIELNRIPEISDAELLRLWSHITPLYRDDLYNLKQAEPPKAVKTNEQLVKWMREIAFTWSPNLVKCFRYNQVGTIITYHAYGAPSLFKPSYAECVAQIQQQLPSSQFIRIMGFSLETNLDAGNCLPDGYHYTRCHLYERCICENEENSGTVIGYHTHDGRVMT